MKKELLRWDSSPHLYTLYTYIHTYTQSTYICKYTMIPIMTYTNKQTNKQVHKHTHLDNLKEEVNPSEPGALKKLLLTASWRQSGARCAVCVQQPLLVVLVDQQTVCRQTPQLPSLPPGEGGRDGRREGGRKGKSVEGRESE